MEKPTPRIGVGAHICHNGKVLVFQRLGALGTGTWSVMGGHLEHGEHWFETAQRESLEEVGLATHSPRLFAITNNVFPDGKHYLTLHVELKTDSPHFTNAEPEKHTNLAWMDWHSIPHPRFPTFQSVYDQNLKPSYLGAGEGDVSNFLKIKQFHTRFDPTGSAETWENLLPRRLSYLAEETREAAEAVQTALQNPSAANRAALVKELVDVLHVTYGFLHLLNVDADAAFEEVHTSNMSKTPNPQGKAIKGETYRPADMTRFVAHSPQT